MNMTVVQRSNRTLHFLHQPVRAEADGAAHGCTRHSRAADAGLSPAGKPLSGGVCGTVLGAQQLQRRLERPSAPATFAITKKLLP